MSKFDISLKLSLAFLGDEWGECYIKFSPITIREAKVLKDIDTSKQNSVDFALELLREKFLDGKGISEGKLIDLSKDDFEELPIAVVNEAVTLMVGNINEMQKKTMN
jgi:hypothetical protein